MVSCAVLGQSNSVLKIGYASHLRSEPGVDLVKLAAVGASSAALGAYFIYPGFCKGIDYCIIDLAIFDHHVCQRSMAFTVLTKYRG
jgi:hypothetical protein